MTEDTTSKQQPGSNGDQEVTRTAGDETDSSQPERPAQAAASLPQEFEKLQSQLEQLRRHAADLDNSRKRLQRDRERELADQQISLLKGLLPVVDNVERAVESLNKVVEPEAMRTGMEQILQLFKDYLARLGVKPIPAVGERCDPNLHEAIAQLPSATHDEGVITAETEKGYFLNERVLRHSRVVVSSGRPAGETGGQANTENSEDDE